MAIQAQYHKLHLAGKKQNLAHTSAKSGCQPYTRRPQVASLHSTAVKIGCRNRLEGIEHEHKAMLAACPSQPAPTLLRRPLLILLLRRPQLNMPERCIVHPREGVAHCGPFCGESHSLPPHSPKMTKISVKQLPGCSCMICSASGRDTPHHTTPLAPAVSGLRGASHTLLPKQPYPLSAICTVVPSGPLCQPGPGISHNQPSHAAPLRSALL